jgi:hypothetical protein
MERHGLLTLSGPLSIPHDIEGLLIHEMGPYHSIFPQLPVNN